MEEEIWFVIIVTLCLALLSKSCIDHFIKRSKISSSLPPQGPLLSPFRLPILGALVWLRKSAEDIETTLRSFATKWGVDGIITPAITIRMFTGRPLIYVFSRTLAHKALIDNGAVFADRPAPVPTIRITSSNQHNITSASYGDTWRILRRNLTSQILHPSKLKSYSNARGWVLDILIKRLMKESTDDGKAVRVVDHFRYAMFCLLVSMCFGDKFEEDNIKKVESVQHGFLVSMTRFQLLNLRPFWLSKLVFRDRWKEFFEMRQRQLSVIIPFITRRKEGREVADSVFSYVDSLLQLEVPDDDVYDNGNSTNSSSSKTIKKRKLTEQELVSACSEFLTAGTDTTTTALQWIMANLVKNPEIQSKLHDEIKRAGVSEIVEEDDLPKLMYLKAVVLEGLRRHPPAHFVLPHAVTHDVEVDGYLFPKNSTINFMVADIGWDAQVWDDPMQFKPERFLKYLLPSSSEVNGDQFDITGSRDIKMMPFGVGRRICPALNLAILHLEYFVGNLIWRFEWKGVEGYEVDLSEKQEFTTVMKYPLHAKIVPRDR